MIPKWTRRQGDEDDTLVIGTTGTVDLLAVTAVEAHIRFNAEPFETLTATVTDGAASQVTVDLSPWLDDADTGCWAITLHFTFAGDIGPITWPEVGAGEITVLPAA